MKIAFFLSDHGFGHLMRNLPVIETLMERGHEVVLVCSERHCQLAKEYLPSIFSIPYHTDVGLVVKPGTLLLDKEKTAEAVRCYVEKWNDAVEFGKRVMSDCDRVVIDICPWAIEAAHDLGKKHYFMASFTWVEQYEEYVDEGSLTIIKDAFRKADNVLYYELANKPTRELLGEGTEIGFVSRRFDEEKVRRIKEAHDRELVVMLLGGSNSGLDFEIDVSNLPYDFITMPAIHLIGDNVTILPVSTPDTQNYVMAADICIAKAGWTTVSEMMIAGNKNIVLKRDDVPEDTMIIEQLERRGLATSIKVEELCNLGEILKEAKQCSHRFTNNAVYISEIIEGDSLYD